MVSIRKLFFLLLFICANSVEAQKTSTVSYDGELVPKRLVRKVSWLTRKDTCETDKFYHLCKWIVKKKSYDMTGYEKIRLEKYSIKKIVRKHTLLCREYSVLLEVMCKQAGIECYIVEGYSKGLGHYPYEKFYYQDHEWNVAKVDGRYQVCDITWASGYTKPKISIIGRIKRLFKLPYIPRHWKFVKRVEPYYFDIPPDKLIETHLSVHPMWQLKMNPHSITYFENEDTTKLPVDSATAYPFANRIQHYGGRSIEEQLLIHGEEGYDFNKKNNYVKGASYLQYSYRKWNSFAKDKDIPLSEKAKRSPEVMKYAKDAEVYMKKFLNDNDGIKQRCFDSLGRKNREVNSFISSRSKSSSRKANSLNSRIKRNDRSNKLSELTITRKEDDRVRRTNSESIYRVRRGNNKKITKDSLNAWFTLIRKNNKHIDSLKLLYQKRRDSIGTYRDRRDNVWDSITYQAGKKEVIVYIATCVDLETNNINYLRYIHKVYDSVHLKQLAFEKNLTPIEAYYKNNVQRYCDSTIRLAMKKIAANKQLLVRIKKYNTKSAEEELLFEEQNQRLNSWLDLSIDNHHREIQHRKEYNSFYRYWNHYAKSEWREFVRYGRAEKECYLFWLKNERFRHSRYKLAGLHGVQNAILLTRRSKVFIANYERQQRILKMKKR